MAPIFMILGTAVSAVGQIASANAAASAANAEAKLQEEQAKYRFAKATYEMDEDERKFRKIQSQQQAVAAASGGGPADPVFNESFSEWDNAARLQTADAKNIQKFEYANAALTRYKGQVEKQAGMLNAASSIIGGVGRLASSPGGFSFGFG